MPNSRKMLLLSQTVALGVSLVLVASCKKDAGERCEEADACAEGLACVGGVCVTMAARRRMALEARPVVAAMEKTCKSSGSLGGAHRGMQKTLETIREAKQLRGKADKVDLGQLARDVLSHKAEAEASLETMKTLDKRVKAARSKNPLLDDTLDSAASAQALRALVQKSKMARFPDIKVRLIDRRLGIDYCEKELLFDVDKALAAASK